MLAVVAVSAGDLERSYYTLSEGAHVRLSLSEWTVEDSPFAEFCDLAADLIDHTAELVAKDIAFLQFDNRTV